MRLRPGLVSDYRADAAIFRSVTQRIWFIGLLALAVVLGFGGLSPSLRYTAVTALFASIAAIGLNIITGMAGQISLGHAFFMGVGAFTAAVLGGVQKGSVIGLQLDMLIWLPAAGLAAALAGFIVAPVATRVRGMYLAFVTVGLVFLGEHIFKTASMISGGPGLGRTAAEVRLLGFRFDQDGEVFGLFMTRTQKLYFLGLILLLIMGLAARNLFRSRVGRALAAIRDRDIAAEMMGIPLARYKLIAFVVSSFYAGIAGALVWAVVGRIMAENFNFLLSIQYIAMILIGGVATVSGAVMGAFFITFLPKLVELLANVLPFISLSATGSGVLSAPQMERILYGLVLIGFLIFEPMGLYGIWIRIRNYWKAWPFSY
jgi:branched-chain amino acid transport system permease protein